MKATKYMVARLSLTTEYTWAVTYYGRVPESGGVETKWDTLDFSTLEDALDFMNYQASKHEELYKDLMLSGEIKGRAIN
jgi:phage terminase large subunit GpA-like protein